MAIVGRVLTILAINLVTWPLLAKVSGELDRSRGSLADQFVYTLTIEGRLASAPKFPKVDGLTVEQTGTQQSQQIFNGSVTSSTTYTYLLTPERSGRFEIPEIAVDIGGRSYKTLPLTLKIAKVNQQQRRKQDIFAERELSQSSVFAGEPLTITNRIFIGVPIEGRVGANELKAPLGTRVIPYESTEGYSQKINERPYEVLEQKFVLIGDKAGTYTIPSFIAQMAVKNKTNNRRRGIFQFPGFSSQSKRVRTEATQVLIKPLPLQGRTKDFSGLVGQFTLLVDKQSESFQVGDNVTITATVKGFGETESMTELRHQLTSIVGLKVYDDKPTNLDKLDQKFGIAGERQFKFAIIPEKPGTYDLGEVSISYFDPVSESYKIAKAVLGQLTVSPGPGSSQAQQPLPPAPTTSKTEVDVLGNDIIGLHDVSRLDGNDQLGTKQMMAMLIVVTFGLLVIAGSWLLANRRLTTDQRLKKYRYQKALGDFNSAMAQAAHEQKADRSSRLVLMSLKQYLAAKLDRPTEAMTSHDLTELMSTADIPNNLIDEAKTLFNQIEALLYGGRDRLADDLVSRAKQLVMRLEETC